MQAVTLNIGDMSYGGCVKSVTRIPESVDDVGKTEVSLEDKDVTVTFNPAKANPDALIEAVEDDDFNASR